MFLYCRVLGIDQDASNDETRRAYKKLVGELELLCIILLQH